MTIHFFTELCYFTIVKVQYYSFKILNSCSTNKKCKVGVIFRLILFSIVLFMFCQNLYLLFLLSAFVSVLHNN